MHESTDTMLPVACPTTKAAFAKIKQQAANNAAQRLSHNLQLTTQPTPPPKKQIFRKANCNEPKDAASCKPHKSPTCLKIAHFFAPDMSANYILLPTTTLASASPLRKTYDQNDCKPRIERTPTHLYGTTRSIQRRQRHFRQTFVTRRSLSQTLGGGREPQAHRSRHCHGGCRACGAAKEPSRRRGVRGPGTKAGGGAWGEYGSGGGGVAIAGINVF